MTQEEIDRVYGLPFTRRPHPSYGRQRIPAFEVVKDSIQIMRGCFGGCAFCSITVHEGRIIQSRSEESILAEIGRMAEQPDFSGTISDLGGPTANMYQMNCSRPEVARKVPAASCLHPAICPLLATDHGPLHAACSKAARRQPGVKQALVASGIRMDLALRSPAYIRRGRPASHRRAAEGRARTRRPRGVAADEQAADRDVRGVRPAVPGEAGRGGQEGVSRALFHRRASGQRPAGDDRPGVVSEAARTEARQGAGLHPRPDGHRHVHVLHGLGSDERRDRSTCRAAARERRLQRALLQYFKPENYADVREALERPTGSIWSATARSV